MLRFQQIMLASLCCLSLLTVTSCSKKEQTPPITYAQHQATLAEQIEEKGAQIIVQGSHLQILLPTDKFFRLQSIELRESQQNTLQLIAIYLKQFMQNHPTQSVIHVTGYTDTVFTQARQRELSRQYAEVITSFLWNQGFSRQQLHVRGLGSHDTIASSRTTSGSGDNRRVVIEVKPK